MRNVFTTPAVLHFATICHKDNMAEIGSFPTIYANAGSNTAKYRFLRPQKSCFHVF
jgi:hypothetical protein